LGAERVFVRLGEEYAALGTCQGTTKEGEGTHRGSREGRVEAKRVGGAQRKADLIKGKLKKSETSRPRGGFYGGAGRAKLISAWDH